MLPLAAGFLGGDDPVKKLPLTAARRLFDGLVIAMLVCAVLFTLSNNFLLGCAVILLGLAATAFHFAVLRCPHCGKHLGRERGDACPHCGKPLTEKDDTDPAAR